MSSSLSAILFTTRDFRDSSYQYILAPQPYGWTCVCWDKIVTIDLTENIKSFLIYTLILNIWASFPDLRRNTLVFCYCWWLMINKVTFTAIINISKRYRGFRDLWSSLICDLWSPCWVLPTFIPYLFPWSPLSFNKPIQSFPYTGNTPFHHLQSTFCNIVFLRSALS